MHGAVEGQSERQSERQDWASRVLESRTATSTPSQVTPAIPPRDSMGLLVGGSLGRRADLYQQRIGRFLRNINHDSIADLQIG